MILATLSSCCCYEYEFWLPFPPAPAEGLLVPGCENTMAVKDGEAPKSHPENA